MKRKQWIAIALMIVMAALLAISAFASELSEDTPNGGTEVTASVSGTSAGDVSYIITIPETVDFGTLVRPRDDSDDSYQEVTFTVAATEIEGLDPDYECICVYVRDSNATVDGDQSFWITGKSDSSKKFSYDVFDISGEEMNVDSVCINRSSMTSASGYFLCLFEEEGESITGTLRLNLTQLCDYSLADIVGDYSGSMVFFSAVEDQ